MQVPAEREKFNLYFNGLLKRGDLNSQRLWAVIQKMLYQFHLQSTYSVGAILSEVYVRGIKFIESDGIIETPGGWIRVTSYNIVRELSRKQRKETRFLEERFLPEQADDNNVDGEVDGQYRLVRQALSSLSPYDRKLLTLKVLEGLPWQLVRSELIQAGEPAISEPALRKRKERAMQRLRKEYQNLYHSSIQD